MNNEFGKRLKHIREGRNIPKMNLQTFSEHLNKLLADMKQRKERLKLLPFMNMRKNSAFLWKSLPDMISNPCNPQ